MGGWVDGWVSGSVGYIVGGRVGGLGGGLGRLVDGWVCTYSVTVLTLYVNEYQLHMVQDVLYNHIIYICGILPYSLAQWHLTLS